MGLKFLLTTLCTGDGCGKCFLLQVKTPIVNAKSKVLVPGLPGHQAAIVGASVVSEKRKKNTDTSEVSSVTLALTFLLTESWTGVMSVSADVHSRASG